MGKKVNNKALQLQRQIPRDIRTELNDVDYNLRKGKVAFENVVHNGCSITDWQGSELKLLIESFKKLETLTWKQILLDNGLNYERNKFIAIPLPSEFPNDAKLCSFRVNQKKRIYGYRAQEFFYIIWFDKNHIVCPMNKPKKFTA